MSKYLRDLDKLRALLAYDPATGLLHWKVRPSRRVRAGDLAGHVRDDGYRAIIVDGVAYYAHILGWAMTYGWAPPYLDHKDGDRDANRLSNLRPATKPQNGANRRSGRNNTSGFKGVARHGSGWRAYVTIERRRINLGTFADPAMAHRAYVEAARLYSGEFASGG